MKILVLSHMYPCTANEAYGIFVHEQVRALVEAGIEIRVVSPTAWTPWPVKSLRKQWKDIACIPEHTVWDGITVHYPRYLSFPRAWFFASSGQRVYRAIKESVHTIYQEFPFDLIHAHVGLPDGYAAALCARELGVPLVVTVHGQDAYHTMHRNARCRRAVRWALGEADRVIVVSSPLRKALEKGLGSIPSAVVIHNGVSIAKISPEPPQVEGTKTVVSLGYLVERKGHEYMLRALAKIKSEHPDAQYIIVGKGPSMQKLKSLAVALGVQEIAVFKGFLPNSQLPSTLASCSVFALPSWDEAFGVVYLEAMANGKPVIGCKGEGIEDFVEHGKTGLLVKPRDVDSLAEALDFLLSNPGEAKTMGEQARKVVLNNYTWEKNAEKTIEVYREVLSER